LVRENAPVTLAPKSFDLLRTFLENPGRALSKAELLDTLWPNTQVEEGNLAFQISVLRKALGPEAGTWIETVPRHGYRLNVPVHVHLETIAAGAPGDVEPRNRRWIYLAAAAVIAIATVGTLITLDLTVQSRSPERVLSPAPLTTFAGDELTPSVSPSGKEVAFVWNGNSRDNWDVYVKLEGVEEPLRITASGAADFSPDWSPDGRSIAFARGTGAGKLDIVVKPYPNGPERKIISARECFMFAAHFDKVLDWHPDGEHLVVAGAEPERGCGLSAISISTGALTRLTEPPQRSLKDTAPAVSPDGRTVAFMRGSVFPTFTIYTVPLADGVRPAGVPAQLTTDDRMELWPAWLSDSKEIVFSGGTSGADGTLFRAPVSERTHATPFQGLDATAYFPSVAPTGKLVYSTRPPFRTSLHRIDLPVEDLNAPEVREIAPSTYLQQVPVHSPNGEQIVFESERSGYREVWIAKTDGTNLRQLTRFNGPTVQSPRWSGDGTRITFTVAMRGQREIYSVDTQRGTPVRLTFNDSDEPVGFWSRDGKWLYLLSNQSGDYQLWKRPAVGGESQQLTTAGAGHPRESPDGRFIYYTRRGQETSLWRVPADGGPEHRLADGLFGLSGPVPFAERVYFVGSPGAADFASPPRFTIRSLELTSGRIHDVANLAGPLGSGLTVAPDQRSLLFVRNHPGTFDLRVVEGLR
jgi:Tol biopolymer transport system component